MLYLSRTWTELWQKARPNVWIFKTLPNGTPLELFLTDSCDQCLGKHQGTCALICGPEGIPFGDVHEQLCGGKPPTLGPAPHVKPQATLMFLN